MSMSVRGSVRTNIRLARRRIRKAPRRVIATWFLQAVFLLLVGSLLPGVLVEDLASALLAALVITGLNVLVRPVIVVLTLPLRVATFGLLSLLINSAIIVLAAPLVPGLEVNGVLPAMSLAILLTVATTVVNVVLAIDEDETFYTELSRRMVADRRVILSVSPPSASMTAPATTRLFASGVESKAETTQRGWTRTVICVDRRRRAAVRCRQRSVPLPPSQCR